jgi:hypothetical protein
VNVEQTHLWEATPSWWAKSIFKQLEKWIWQASLEAVTVNAFSSSKNKRCISCADYGTKSRNCWGVSRNNLQTHWGYMVK